MTDSQSEERRKELFSKLVELQDQGASVGESRRQLADEFDLAEDDVREIEREGLAMKWPPLS